VAGDAKNGATVDTDTCATSGTGFATLCTVWEDPTFKPDQRAFYYARVLENPICRWSTKYCNDLGVDCSDPGSVPAQYVQCCGNLVEKTIQERAWTSPVFYQPEGFGVQARLRYGASAGTDSLKMQLLVGKVGDDLDFTGNPLTITLSDDNTIYTATLPAGALVEKKPGRAYQYTDKTGSIAGITSLKIKISAVGTAKVLFAASDLDLSAADKASHDVTVQLTSGAYDHSDTRTWNLVDPELRSEP
jgi:hypothetical protein